MTEYNPERPLVMHIDLNSCFATIEQQARPRLRDRPIAVVNRRTEHTCVITASYEAKRCGVKVGMPVREARALVPDLILVEADPPKYRYVYKKLIAILSDYSPNVVMKSIDEGLVDFHQATAEVRGRDLEDIGRKIKRRLKQEVGNVMRCNVGIGPNRFLAKTAAGLHKPDGLDVINYTNLRQTFAGMKLTDLTGIATHYDKRLRSVGICTPLQFLDADVVTLRKMVFKSVNGDYWHQRLRGWEVDDVVFDVKTVGRQYVLDSMELEREEILLRLHNLCESVGAKLRKNDKAARGVYVYAKLQGRERWFARSLSALPFYSDAAIYERARAVFTTVPPGKIREIGVSCYYLTDDIASQLSLFGDELARERELVQAVDEINSRFGERTIHAASTVETTSLMRPKIPFGSTRYL